jgi:predicted RNase H-like HicB family nuclease
LPYLDPGKNKMKRKARSKRIFDVIITYWPDIPGPYKYAAEVPVPPGCFSDGRTREEAIRNIKDAIALYLTTLEERLSRQDVVKVKV